MTDILENDLVRKYFGCGCETAGCLHPHEAILKSMQEPVRKGDRVLSVWHLVDFSTGITEIKDEIYPKDMLGAWHPDTLRLPDRFQTAGKKECQGIMLWNQSHCPGCTAVQVPREPFIMDHPADAVEAKIKVIKEKFLETGYGTEKTLWCYFEPLLRELVALAREGK